MSKTRDEFRKAMSEYKLLSYGDESPLGFETKCGVCHRTIDASEPKYPMPRKLQTRHSGLYACKQCDAKYGDS